MFPLIQQKHSEVRHLSLVTQLYFTQTRGETIYIPLLAKLTLLTLHAA